MKIVLLYHIFCIDICCLFGVQKLSDRIKKLQESELTLDDMDSEDTNYVLEEKCVITNTCKLHITPYFNNTYCLTY